MVGQHVVLSALDESIIIGTQFGNLITVRCGAPNQRQFPNIYRQPMEATPEASYSWAPMYDWPDEVADDVVRAHPAKVRAIAEARITTD